MQQASPPPLPRSVESASIALGCKEFVPTSGTQHMIVKLSIERTQCARWNCPPLTALCDLPSLPPPLPVFLAAFARCARASRTIGMFQGATCAALCLILCVLTTDTPVCHACFMPSPFLQRCAHQPVRQRRERAERPRPLVARGPVRCRAGMESFACCNTFMLQGSEWVAVYGCADVHVLNAPPQITHKMSVYGNPTPTTSAGSSSAHSPARLCCCSLCRASTLATTRPPRATGRQRRWAAPACSSGRRYSPSSSSTSCMVRCATPARHAGLTPGMKPVCWWRS